MPSGWLSAQTSYRFGNPLGAVYRSGMSAAVSLLFLFVFAMHAGSVRTLDGQSFEGELRLHDNGAVIVQASQGKPATIALTNIAQATFASGPFFSAGSILPNGWAVQDIGEVRGFARLDGDAFQLRVEGLSTNSTACHYLHRPMPSDGEILARIDRVGGDGAANAGVMIRGLSGSPVFASLSCGNDGKLWFNRRPDPDRKELRTSAGWTVSPPVWLRLQKRGKQIIAAFSKDGEVWQNIAVDSVKLAPEKAWREYEGELLLSRASFGVFGSSRGKDTTATAAVSRVSMTLHGLLGEYFSDQQFKGLKFARLDAQLHFRWGLDSPDPSLPRDDFSVRWTGQLIPPKSGQYRFYFDADDRARLWIAGEARPQASMKTDEKRPAAPPPPVTLVAGRPVDFKMEFDEGGDTASVKLGWAFRNHSTPDVIAMTNFLYRFDATNAPERIAAPRPGNDMPAVRGVLLRDGSFIAGTVASADESAIRLSFAGRKDVPVLNSRVARIFLRPPRQPLRFEIAGRRTGLFLKSGDFFESDFHSIRHGALNMSSVLFGLKRFSIEGSDPVAVVLNDCAPARATFEVRLLDGSVLRAAKLTATSQAIAIDEPILGNLSFPAAELFEIRPLGARAPSR
jgi:hypothetical protein